ncbi:MAG: Bacterial CdiA-CT RNAse domain [Frankiaceae bacterium]|nr:Bacterial CdiA-CT RNAse domain [Frankiaceae bacterium]
MNEAGGAPSAQQTWVIPQMPDDDVAALRALAATYRRLSGALRDLAGQLRSVVAPLPMTWAGAGAAASGHPIAVVLADIEQVCTGLDAAAVALDDGAARLEDAQERHRWSWQKIVKVGAIVVVSGAAIYVTAGLAAPEVAAASSAAISGEVAVSEVAVASAVTARTGLSVALSTSSRLFAAVRGLGAVVRPQLPYAIAFTGADASGDVAEDGQLDVKRVATSFGLNLALPGAMRGSSQLVRSLPLLLDRPAAAAVAGHTAAGAAVSGLDATRQQILNGRVDRGQVVHAGVNAAALSASGDLTRRLTWTGRGSPGLEIVPGAEGDSATVWPGQMLDVVLREGVDLRAHEGSGRGHTAARHVGKPWTFLQSRLDNEKGSMKSSFYDQKTAEDAITQTLRAHRQQVEAFDRGSILTMDPLKLTLPDPIGRVLTRQGDQLAGRTCVVVLRRDAQGAFIYTAFVAP